MEFNTANGILNTLVDAHLLLLVLIYYREKECSLACTADESMQAREQIDYCYYRKSNWASSARYWSSIGIILPLSAKSR